MLPVEPVVLVVGATGYVGRETVVAALERSHVKSVVAHVRPGSSGAAGLREKVSASPHSIRCSIEEVELEPAAVAALLDRVGPTHVFLCHGTTKKRAAAEGVEDPYEAIDVGLTQLFVDAAAQQEGDPGLGPRIVYLSSMGTSKGAKGTYLKARWRAERVIADSGLPHTICRAPLLSGPDRPEKRSGEIWAARLLRPALGLVGLIGMKRLAARYAPMDGVEAAEGLVRSGFHYMTINRVVLADELRREGVYEKESWTPESRRDQPRF